MKIKNESGIALIAALLLLILMGVMLQVFIVRINSSQRMLGTDLGSDRTFAGAYAALERLTQKMANLLNSDNLTEQEIERLVNQSIEITNDPTKYKYDELTGEIIWKDSDGNKITIDNPKIIVGETKSGEIKQGAYKGLRANITTYTISVTARSTTGDEVTLERKVQVVLIPVFQFGVFSNNDLAFFPGNDFNFGGRVHTNGNLWLGNGLAGTTPPNTIGLRMSDYVSTHKIIKTQTKPNGAGYTGDLVYILKKKPASVTGDYRQFKRGDGLDSSDYNGNVALWRKEVGSQYNGYLNVETDELTLPIVGGGKNSDGPIEAIRRGQANESEDLLGLRYYSLASLRILISDRLEDLKFLPEVVGDPQPLEGSFPSSSSPIYKFAQVPPGSGVSNNYGWPANTPLVGGYILIEKQLPKGEHGERRWKDVTDEILRKGVTGAGMVNPSGAADDRCGFALKANSPDSIIRVQRIPEGAALTDTPTNRTTCNNYVANGETWPNVLFDAREGSNTNGAPSNLAYNGVMHYVEIDIANLSKWLKGQIESGEMVDIIVSEGHTNDESTQLNNRGYVVYFSDRRGSSAVGTPDTARYNYESVNDWDLDGDGRKGTTARLVNSVRNSSGNTYSSSLNPANPMATISIETAKRARPVYFRRALKLVNGAKIDVGVNTRENTPFGLTIASENPVYVQGDYNYVFSGTRPNNDTANTSAENDFKDNKNQIKIGGSVGAAVVADAVTILSNNWRDFTSFQYTSLSNRTPNATFYRMAVIAGKNATHSGSGDWGTDGGVHNFLRMLEDWSDRNNVFYRGSLISMYYSFQAMSAFKTGVYAVPKRRFSFEESYIINPATLPPRTPMVRYIDILSFTRTTGGKSRPPQ